MSVQPFERLAYQNRFVKELIQPLSGVDCFQERADLNADENLIALRLTEAQFIQIYSSLLTGADICYPDESLQIVANFLKGLHCPPQLVPRECLEYPPYSPFIGYPLQNPFSQPDLVPGGYLVPPFKLVTAENIDEYPQNEIGDIVVPFGAITFDANWFEDVSESLPTITINFQGTGQANIRLLNQAQGGLAIITLDNPPNLLDIIAGIISGSDNIIDTNLDIVSLPPETAVEHIFPVPIETEGLHTVYVVFFPIIDDSLIPVRFGGGFRGVELCGELEIVEMGVTDIRFVLDEPNNRYELEKLNNGVWETVALGEDVGQFWTDTNKLALDAFGLAYAIRNTEPFDSWYSGDFQGWQPSPLKTYIDNGDAAALEAANSAIDTANSASSNAALALENAAEAQATANSAVTVNGEQNIDIAALQAQNTAQGISIDNLQDDYTALELRVQVAEADILFIDSRVDSAEVRLNALDSGGAWYHIDDFTSSDGGYADSFGTYVGGVGWVSDDDEIVLTKTGVFYDNQITHLQVAIRAQDTTGTPEIQLGWEGSYIAAFDWQGNGEVSTAWLRIPNQALTDEVKFRIRILTGGGGFTVLYARYLGRGALNPFD